MSKIANGNQSLGRSNDKWGVCVFNLNFKGATAFWPRYGKLTLRLKNTPDNFDKLMEIGKFFSFTPNHLW